MEISIDYILQIKGDTYTFLDPNGNLIIEEKTNSYREFFDHMYDYLYDLTSVNDKLYNIKIEGVYSQQSSYPLQIRIRKWGLDSKMYI